MTKILPDRPEHVPRGYEWLPDAYKRDVEPHGPEARERVRYALAEGDIKALLLLDLGHEEPIDGRMWRKTPLARKVYPRFLDGRMRIGLHPYRGPHVWGWVFVPEGSLAQVLSQPGSTKNRSTKFSRAELEDWYRGYIEALVAEGKTPSRDEDLRAARKAFKKTIPRAPIRELRRRFAPPEWQRGGRRPEKPGRN